VEQRFERDLKTFWWFYGLVYIIDDVKMLYLDKNIMEILTADHRSHYQTIYNNNAQYSLFMHLCIMFWMRAYPLRGQVGRGWALDI